MIYNTRNSRFKQKSNSLRFQELLNLLAQITSFSPKIGNNGNYIACCPAHGDKAPSLSLKEANDGTILINCFALCSKGEICAALGIHISQLFPSKKF